MYLPYSASHNLIDTILKFPNGLWELQQVSKVWKFLLNKLGETQPLEDLSMKDTDSQSESDKERRITLNNKQKSTLDKICQSPLRSDIAWSDILDLLKTIGKVSENDDRVFVLIQHNPEVKCGVLHRRKRQRNASQSTIRDLQEFLMDIEIEL
ncbi:hypothetical protein H6G89_29090 [Oscillatoria sp. FACHB-1407]|uniref:hypothetical protein n=1 Tax=Oscillatoria sp. FACHB-1407 TaxID=2692847 RepID=UPI0016893D86|nr:hypothetical protein [Oscillatoria sp. FACHB-1407]MBD2465067.1 hypothetical protein [Oscillatoria sp. FACHB-1407]